MEKNNVYIITWEIFDIKIKDNANVTLGKGKTQIDLFLDIVEIFSKIVYDLNNGEVQLLSDSLYLIIHEYRRDIVKLSQLIKKYKGFKNENITTYIANMSNKYNIDIPNETNDKNEEHIRAELSNKINNLSNLLMNKIKVQLPPKNDTEALNESIFKISSKTISRLQNKFEVDNNNKYLKKLKNIATEAVVQNLIKSERDGKAVPQQSIINEYFKYIKEIEKIELYMNEEHIHNDKIN